MAANKQTSPFSYAWSVHCHKYQTLSNNYNMQTLKVDTFLNMSTLYLT